MTERQAWPIDEFGPPDENGDRRIKFDKACDDRWAKDPDRHTRHFFAAACEVYMQEHNLHWGRDLSGFDPDDMKMLGRWLNKCVAARDSDTP